MSDPQIWQIVTSNGSDNKNKTKQNKTKTKPNQNKPSKEAKPNQSNSNKSTLQLISSGEYLGCESLFRKVTKKNRKYIFLLK